MRTSRKEKHHGVAVHRVRRGSSLLWLRSFLVCFFFSFWCYSEPKPRGEELRLGSVLKLKTCKHLSSVLLDLAPSRSPVHYHHGNTC